MLSLRNRNYTQAWETPCPTPVHCDRVTVPGQGSVVWERSNCLWCQCLEQEPCGGMAQEMLFLQVTQFKPWDENHLSIKIMSCPRLTSYPRLRQRRETGTFKGMIYLCSSKLLLVYKESRAPNSAAAPPPSLGSNGSPE